jgi:hypothetical protein
VGCHHMSKKGFLAGCFARKGCDVLDKGPNTYPVGLGLLQELGPKNIFARRHPVTAIVLRMH